jgi:transcriptional regulator with XRE-family HTH domain
MKMDNAKTGELIATIRKEKGMTQQNIADNLHITSKAVSKWERGLSFPSVDVLEKLASLLGISVMDILAGEIIEHQNVTVKADELSIQVLQSEKQIRKKFIVVCATSIFLIIAVVIYGWGPTIFQRGNPLPYLAASIRIDERQPYIEVGNNSGIYISKQGDCPELFEYIQEHWNVELVEQAGSGYVFTNGIANLIVSSEIYWSKFTVWQVPQTTLQDK